MRLEQAVHIHRAVQRQDEEFVIVSIGDVQFGALVPRAELKEHAVRIIEQALAWARREL